jgi:hypothetical protein
MNKSFLIIAIFSALVIFAGCNKAPGKDALARVGSRELTRQELAALAGVPWDSLNARQKWHAVNVWIETALVNEEATRRHLDKDGEIAGKLEQVKSELYRSKLLADIKAPVPNDSAIDYYYAAHKQEFLRAGDAFLLELYWAESREMIAKFREQLTRGDTTLLRVGDVSSEGKWLAEAGELPSDLEKEVSTLQPGEITFPRPYEDGFRIVRLVETYPAGRPLDLSAVRDEIANRLILEQSRKREDTLMTTLRERFPVRIFLKDS